MAAHRSSYCLFVLVLAMATLGVSSAQTATDQPSKTTACSSVSGLDVDDSSAVNAPQAYQAVVADLLAAENFSTLECIADSARNSKAKMSGGMWKLHMFYFGLVQPQGHATEEDWQTHLTRLKRWMAAYPDSVTPQIALADAYIAYADEARGGGTADSVTESGWRLFSERLAQAQAVVDKAEKSSTRDPELLLAQIGIAWSQGWDLNQMTALVKSASKLEPTYYYYYRIYATYLLPKWYGEEDDMRQFATAISDHIGGDDGDIVYFEIAVSQICHCGDDEVALKSLSWPRIQKGFAAQEKRSGPSLYNMNQMAFMAMTFNDMLAADKLFQRIGDRWSEDAWHLQSYYEACKKSAAEAAPFLAAKQNATDQVEANLKTAEGQRYQAEVQQAMEKMVRECASADSTDLNQFSLTLRISTTGTLERMNVNSPSHLFGCVMKKMWDAEQAKQPLLPPAPKPSYWVKIDVDPQALTAAPGK